MECFFSAELNHFSKDIILRGDEFRHFRALRLQNQEIVAVVNGKGLAGIGYISSIGKDFFQVRIQNFVLNFGEIEQNITIAIGILDNKERLEYAFEKAVELRVKEFIPIITKFTQKKIIDFNRLTRKGISAIKQTKRSILPTIHPPTDFQDLIKKFPTYEKVIVADSQGNNISRSLNFTNCLVIIGPEGGFHHEEYINLSKLKNLELINLGEFRLRSETAATILLGVLLLSTKN